MAATGFTPISLYYSTTASTVPLAANLANGELALNTADMKLYAKNSSGVVTLLASNASTTGVDSLSFGSTGLTPSTATTGAITVAGTLNVSNGGTGLTSLTAGYIPFGAGTSAFSSSANLFWDSANARLGIGTSSPAQRLSVAGAGNFIGTGVTASTSPTVYLSNTTASTGRVYGLNSTDGGLLQIFDASAGNATRVVLDSSGNLGLGVTPSAWATLVPTMQIGSGGSFLSGQGGTSAVYFGTNAYYNAGWKYVNTGSAATYYTQNGGEHQWHRAPSGTAGNAITFTQAMTLDASGSLLVGRTAKLNTEKFSVLQAAGSDGIALTDAVNATAFLSIVSAGTALNTNGALLFGTGSSYTERARIDSSGNLLMGTTSSLGYSGLVFNMKSSGSYVGLNASSTEARVFATWDTTSIPMTFYMGGVERTRISAAGGFSVGTTADPGVGAIYATGNITAYYSSDIKFKENVRDIPNALATVNAIGGKLFDWTDEYIDSKGGADGYFVQKADFGVVAQDVQKVFPIAVRTRPDGSLAVDYEKLGALAFAAVGELTTLVQTLIARVEALEAK